MRDRECVLRQKHPSIWYVIHKKLLFYYLKIFDCNFRYYIFFFVQNTKKQASLSLSQEHRNGATGSN